MREKPMPNPEAESLKPEVVEIPGRTMLETDTELAEKERERIDNQNGDPSRELIKNPEGRVLYEKRWDYYREQTGAEGEWQDSRRLKSVSERKLEYGDNKNPDKPTRETGRHLAREHSWETDYQYDEQGRCTDISGRVTEGEKKGEKWNETKTYEAIGEYTKVTSVNESEKPGEEPKKTIKIEYRNAEGNSVYGKKITVGKPETHHTWGEKPENVPDIVLE